MLPVTLDSLGDFRSRHFYLLSDTKARQVDEHKVLVALNTYYADAANLALTRCAGIGDVGVDDDILRHESEE